MNIADAPRSPEAAEARRLPGWVRWLHIYLSMLGLAALLFFSLTGITLNHPDWMLGGRRHELKAVGNLDPAWLAPGADAKAVNRLAVAEQLRRLHHLGGWVDEFRVEERECAVTFKGPGSYADVFIQRPTGAYQLTATTEGYVAWLNDLHKGRHTGPVWSVLIDVTAGLLGVMAVSGIWLLLYVRRRRTSGLWVGLVGTLLLWLVYVVGVR